MSGELASLLQAVSDVARVAGDVAVSHYRRAIAVETKSDGSPVTIADREAETAARDWLSERFPRDAIEGEEFGLTRAGATRRWVIDPIDGTKAFIRGVPLWGTLVAVCEGPDVLAGCAYFPVLGDVAAAARGEGCWWNGSVARVSAVSSLGSATVLTTSERIADDGYRAGWQRLSEQAGVSRTWGDCYGYFLVATGRAEVMTDAVMNDWDSAAVMPLIEEAGGVFTDWSGRRTAFGGSSIATNAALADQARALLRP